MLLKYGATACFVFCQLGKKRIAVCNTQDSTKRIEIYATIAYQKAKKITCNLIFKAIYLIISITKIIKFN